MQWEHPPAVTELLVSAPETQRRNGGRCRAGTEQSRLSCLSIPAYFFSRESLLK